VSKCQRVYHALAVHLFRRCSLTLLFLGTIELHELQQVMRKLGQNPTEAELIEMINSVDDNGDHEIDFEEFLILMKSRIGERDPERELKDAFAIFDTDGNGTIDRKELKRLMKKLGQALTEAELDAMMDEVDSDGDGVISFQEFKSMMVRWSHFGSHSSIFSRCIVFSLPSFPTLLDFLNPSRGLPLSLVQAFPTCAGTLKVLVG
jgi:Ca2+-binding EF-hand superfamily protein